MRGKVYDQREEDIIRRISSQPAKKELSDLELAEIFVTAWQENPLGMVSRSPQFPFEEFSVKEIKDIAKFMRKVLDSVNK